MPWSDHWCFEGEKAYFIDAMDDNLYEVDLGQGIYKYIRHFGSLYGDFRCHPRCRKIGDRVICYPDMGKDILIYDLITKQLDKVSIYNPDNKRIGMRYDWEYHGQQYVLSFGLNSIFEMDIDNCTVKHIVTVTDEEDILNTNGIVVDRRYLYVPSVLHNRIYCIDVLKKTRERYEIPMMTSGIYTMTFDGKYFWLSGKKREIYRWEKKINAVSVIDKLPKEFGYYEGWTNWEEGNAYPIKNTVNKEYPTGLFFGSVDSEKFVWFIPAQASHIIRLDKQTLECSIFDMRGEDNSPETYLNNMMKHKYVVSYVREERYVGLYSFNTSRMYEIDLDEDMVNIIHYTLTDESVRKMEKEKGVRKVEQELMTLFSVIGTDNSARGYFNKDGNAGRLIWEKGRV